MLEYNKVGPLEMCMGMGIELKITVHVGKKIQLIFFFRKNSGAAQ